MSPDEAVMTKAVVADPDDDGPRLFHAQCLLESSRLADQARGEFIRIQVELVDLPDTDAAWAELVGRERDLLEEFRPDWERPLRNRLHPSPRSPGKWLRSHLFGSGGLWGFRRGYVEHVLAPAPTFLAEDAALLPFAPIRRVVLGHASEHLAALLADRRLDALKSLHLVGDMETDEDLEFLADQAKAAGLTVVEMRIPRLWHDAEDLFELLRTRRDEVPAEAGTYPAWESATPDARDRLWRLAQSRRVLQLESDPAHEGELLFLNEHVYLGSAVSDAKAWAVAKSHHDLEDDEGRCRRLVLLRDGDAAPLRASPYCHA